MTQPVPPPPVPDPPILVPLDQIDPAALLRDRLRLDPADLAALTSAIAAEGLRLPIEIWELSDPRPPFRYGLISGLRRLTACRALGHPAIPAFLRTPGTIESAMAAMISENENRSPVSPWEKGALILAATAEGLYDTLDAAVAGLYPRAPRQSRSRLRAFASVVEALDGWLTAPEAQSTPRMERLAAALRAGQEERLLTALRPLEGAPLQAQWQALQPVMQEIFLAPEDPLPGRPRMGLYLRQGLKITREPCRGGWILRFTGPEAKDGGLVDDVLDEVERLFQPKR